jgi:hypothetical protein
MNDRATCIVVVPANYGIEPECEQSLLQLERRGYQVWRVPGFANIDQCRNEVATDVLARGFEELFWIDADVAFHPDAVDRLRSHNLPLISGIYPKKSRRSLASRLFPSTKEIKFGVGGGVIEILYAATGFLHTRREIYEAVRRHCNLPTCNEQWGKPTVPYFMPLVIETERGPWYLGDDFSFSHRARQAGYKIYADTTIRLGHIGRYAFSWEDAGGSNQRFGSYIYQVLDVEE